MVQVASGAAVMMDIIGGINVTRCTLVRIDTIPTIGAGTRRIPVIMDIAVADLVAIGPDGDSAFWAVADFKAINEIVAAIDVESDVAVRGVQSVDDGPAFGVRFQHNRSGGSATGTQMNSPAARIISVDSGQDVNCVAGTCQTVTMGYGPAGLGRCAGIGIVALGGYIQIRRSGVKD